MGGRLGSVIGVLLLNLGGPDSLDAVKPFLYNLFSDRDIIRLGPPFLQKPIAALIAATRAQKTIEAYKKIGGGSPIRDITNAQAKALEDLLGSSPIPRDNPPLAPLRKEGEGGFEEEGQGEIRVYVGMRYWHPFIEDAVEGMYKDGIKKILALSLYPHYSKATTGSSVRKFEQVVSRYPVEYFSAPSWFNHPLYIDALIEKIREGMTAFGERPVVLFSAHSLPRRFIDEGDPYVTETHGTIQEIAQKIEMEWYLSYQSKSGPVKWLEPSTEHMLGDLGRKGVKKLLVVPISFVSDHIETLYEIDLLYRDMAHELGMEMRRADSLNTSPKFVEALADMVLKNLRYRGWL